mmetsp:Transcript_41032/g.130405  ORF Transcript_41032/g.130405 Transcript_41032/m.130405 type:complete len:644 (+) Transcript_41032:243-2174(+)
MDVQGYLETVRLLPRAVRGSGEGGRCPSSDKSRHVPPDSQRFSVGAVLVALGFMYSVHNLIAPNMTAIARLFHFNNFERDAYIGGELTLFFYFPGVLGALLAGLLSGVMERRLLLAVLALLTSISCFLTTQVHTFSELVWARAVTGLGIGGSLPVVYSLVGDWYPARRRASATAYVTAASGAGVFAGQCIATLMGSVDWRWPFLVIAIPSAVASATLCFLAEEPIRGGQEDGVETLSLCQHAGLQYMPALSARHLRALMHNKTNLLVILQAFPGNIPWGVIIVYIHDFLVQDLGLSRHSALGAITTLAAAAFVGILTGGCIGEALYGGNSRHIAIFGGVCNTARALPFFVLFGWKSLFGPLEHSSEGAFFILLMVGGFVATMASPCTGAMLLNVNLPETRGTIMAMYSVLDDLSKGFGTLFVSMIVPLVGGRAVAYQISLLLWVFTGVALLYAVHTYDEDEEQMRKHLDEAAKESMVLISKQRAQQAIRDRAKAAGEAHFAQRNLGIRRDQFTDLQWPSSRRAPWGSASQGASSLEGSLEAGRAAQDRSNAAASGTGAGLGLGVASGALCPRTGGAAGGRRAAAGSAPSRFHADRARLHSAVRAAAQAAAASPAKAPVCSPAPEAARPAASAGLKPQAAADSR